MKSEELGGGSGLGGLVRLAARLGWLVAAVWLLLAAGPGCAWAEAVKDLAQPTSYVDDLAGVIDPGAKAQMEALAAEVEREAHATIEIVTVHSLGGADIDEFATQLEDKWKVGPKGTDRGVILLFAIDDHKRRIEVGYGLEGVLNDAKVGDIGRSMVPDLRAGDYGSAILGGERQIAADIAQDAGVTLTPLPGAGQPRRAARGGGGFGIFPVIVIAIVLWLMFRGRGGRGGGGGGGGWLPWFLLGNVIGGGGRGGGGGFDGGGGGGGGDDGGFSGGFGGSSGGGGASGDWLLRWDWLARAFGPRAGNAGVSPLRRCAPPVEMTPSLGCAAAVGMTASLGCAAASWDDAFFRLRGCGGDDGLFRLRASGWDDVVFCRWV